jgi:superfamily II DNA helicase RecQ
MITITTVPVNAQMADTRIPPSPLHTALKAWRSEVARKRGVPAYVVLRDSTIDGIAAVHPATLTEPSSIAGICDKKLEHYANELIALVKAAGTPKIGLCVPKTLSELMT